MTTPHDRTFLVVVHTLRSDVDRTVEDIRRRLDAAGVRMKLESDVREAPDDAAVGCEVVVVLGGDGGFLRGAELARREHPRQSDRAVADAVGDAVPEGVPGPLRGLAQDLVRPMAESAAQDEGVEFVDMSQVSEGHDACAGAQRWIEPMTTSGPGAVHPNEKGQAAIAEQVRTALAS